MTTAIKCNSNISFKITEVCDKEKKHIVMYARDLSFLIEKWNVIVAYTRKVDPQISIDNIKIERLDSEDDWAKQGFTYSLYLDEILPSLVRTLYGDHRANRTKGNCHGAALVSTGLFPAIQCFGSPWDLRIIAEQSDDISIDQLSSGDLVYLCKKDWLTGHSFVFLDHDISLSMNGASQSLFFYTTANILEAYQYPPDRLKKAAESEFPIRIIRKKNGWQYPEMVTSSITTFYDLVNSQKQDPNYVKIKEFIGTFHAYALQPNLSSAESEAAKELFHALTENLIPQDTITLLPAILSPLKQFVENRRKSSVEEDLEPTALDQLVTLTFKLISENANKKHIKECILFLESILCKKACYFIYAEQLIPKLLASGDESLSASAIRLLCTLIAHGKWNDTILENCKTIFQSVAQDVNKPSCQYEARHLIKVLITENKAEELKAWIDNDSKFDSTLRSIFEDMFFTHLLATDKIEEAQKLSFFSRKAYQHPSLIENYCGKLIQSNCEKEAEDLACNYLHGTSRDSIFQQIVSHFIQKKVWGKALVTCRKIEDTYCRISFLHKLVAHLANEQLWDLGKEILEEIKTLDQDKNLYCSTLYSFLLKFIHFKMWTDAKSTIALLVELKSSLITLALMNYSISLSQANQFEEAHQAAEAIEGDCNEKVSALKELSICLSKVGESQKAYEINLRVAQVTLAIPTLPFFDLFT